MGVPSSATGGDVYARAARHVTAYLFDLGDLSFILALPTDLPNRLRRHVTTWLEQAATIIDGHVAREHVTGQAPDRREVAAVSGLLTSLTNLDGMKPLGYDDLAQQFRQVFQSYWLPVESVAELISTDPVAPQESIHARIEAAHRTLQTGQCHAAAAATVLHRLCGAMVHAVIVEPSGLGSLGVGVLASPPLSDAAATVWKARAAVSDPTQLDQLATDQLRAGELSDHELARLMARQERTVSRLVDAGSADAKAELRAFAEDWTLTVWGPAYAGERITGEHSVDPSRKALAFRELARVIRDPLEIVAAYQAGQALAEALVDRYWLLIRRIAQELATRHAFSGEELENLFAAVDADEHLAA